MMINIHIRPMCLTDLDTVLKIQNACYHEIVPESEQSICAKLTASPQTCFVACSQHTDKAVQGEVAHGISEKTKEVIAGYMLALPVARQNLPELNSAECIIPAQPDCLYLHDMAVAPDYQGMGVSTKLLKTFQYVLNTSAFEYAALVAIQNSVAYWKKWGFTPIPAQVALQNKLASYGKEARYMEMHRTVHNTN